MLLSPPSCLSTRSVGQAASLRLLLACIVTCAAWMWNACLWGLEGSEPIFYPSFVELRLFTQWSNGQ